MASFGVWLNAARPKTLGAAVAPVIIGTALAWKDGGLHIPSAVSALLGTVFIQIGTNFCNDYCDHRKGADTADRVGPVRATAAGLVTPRQMLAATVLAFAASLIVWAYLLLRAPMLVAIGSAAAVVSGVLYTAGPKPLAYVGLGDLFVFIFFGPVAVAATHYVQTLSFSPVAAVLGIAPGLLSVAILVVNNLRDIEGDARAGKRTLAVRFGPRFAKVEYLACVFGACCVPAVLALKGLLPLPCAAVSCVIVSAIPPMRLVLRRSGASLNPALGGTAKVLVFFAILFAVGCGL